MELGLWNIMPRQPVGDLGIMVHEKDWPPLPVLWVVVLPVAYRILDSRFKTGTYSSVPPNHRRRHARF